MDNTKQFGPLYMSLMANKIKESIEISSDPITKTIKKPQAAAKEGEPDGETYTFIKDGKYYLNMERIVSVDGKDIKVKIGQKYLQAVEEKEWI